MNTELADELEVHLRLLRRANTEATAIEWMKRAYVLMERAADEMKRPRIFSIPGHFGAPTFAVDVEPYRKILPAHGRARPLVWTEGETVVYGDKYANKRTAWTRADTLQLEREAIRRNAEKLKSSPVQRRGK